MMTVNKRLLRVRDKARKSRPKFRRQESWRYKRLKTSWRKPIGIDNAMRHHKRGIPTIAGVGYRGPKATRGLTRSGKVEVLVHNTYDLEDIDKETQIARIASTVGTRKKVAITNKADELEIKIINRPEEALTFATISEISEELLLEEDEGKKETKEKAPRKKKSTGTTLSEKELEELEKIEEELAKKSTTRKKPATTTTPKKTTTTTKKPTTTPKKPSTTTKKSTATAKKPTTTTKKPATTTKKTTTTTPKKPATTTKKAPTSKKPATTAKKTTSSTTSTKSTSSKQTTTTKKATTKKT